MASPTLSPKRPHTSNGAARTHVRYPATMSSGHPPRGIGPFALVAVVSVMLGILVGVLGIFAIAMWFDARDAKDAAEKAAGKVTASGICGDHVRHEPLELRGRRPDELRGRRAGNADELANAHKPFRQSCRRSSGARSRTSISSSRT